MSEPTTEQLLADTRSLKPWLRRDDEREMAEAEARWASRVGPERGWLRRLFQR